MALKLLDVDKFIRNYQAKPVTSSRTFSQDFSPAPGGLQDPSIFGVSTQDKFQRWGYINLEDVILHPLVYDNLNEIHPDFKKVVQHKIKATIVDGKIKEDPNGNNGLAWLISNWDKINLDKYRTEKNKLWIDFLKNTKKNLIFVNKVPVIPIAYREARVTNRGVESSDIDDLYKSILSKTKSQRNDFTLKLLEATKDQSGKEIIQNKVNALFDFFIKKIEGKSGFIRGALLAKRLDNVSRMVANARPDIPINSAVIPWHILLNLFDVFVVAYLTQEENSEIAKKLGVLNKDANEFGQLFDYIYRNVDTYTKHYPEHKKLWIQILTDIFNENPLMRVLLKRDPGWNADSLWCFQPLINSENSYQIWVPSWVYSPLGGDSFNTNFFIQERDTSIIYEDLDFVIEANAEKTYVVKTLDSVWKQLQREAS